MPGFRVSHSDLDGLDDKFQCRLCGFVFRDPVQTSCGHVYCHSCCFESTTDVLCVEDGTVIREKESFRDRYMEREVLRQEVGCTFQDEGCSWRGMICHLEQERLISALHNCLDLKAAEAKADVVLALQRAIPKLCKFVGSSFEMVFGSNEQQSECERWVRLLNTLFTETFKKEINHKSYWNCTCL